MTLESKLQDQVLKNQNRYELNIKPNNYMIIRIDGHKFSKVTKKLEKPFSYTLSKLMEETTLYLASKV